MRALYLLAFLIMLSVSSGRSTRKPKTACLEELVNRLVRKDEDLILIHDRRDKECFPILKLKNPKVVVDFKREFKGSLNINATFVICVNSNSGLSDSLKKLKKSSLWKNGSSARAKYLIISGESNIKRMGKILFRWEITKATLLQRKVGSKTPKIVKRKYKFFKQYTRSCKYTVIDNIVKIPKIGEIKGDFELKQNQQPIIEGLKIIGKALGVEIQFLVPGTKCFHTRSVCLYSITKLESTNPHYLSMLDYTVPCIEDRLTWLVPKIQKTNYHKSMLFVFEWETSILLAIVFTLMVVKSWLASRRLREHNELQRLSTWILIVAQLMVAVPTSLFPNRTCLRILLIFYMFYCFQISNWFQGYMTSVLVDPPNEPELETEYELYKSSIPLYLAGFEMATLQKVHPKMYGEIKDKLIIGSKLSNLAKAEFCAKRGCAFLISEDEFLNDFSQLKSRFYILKYGDIGLTGTIYALIRGHHIFKKLNYIQEVINECGIYRKILRDMKKEKPSTNAGPESNIYLRLPHLKEVFVLFAIGMSIATIALITELIYYYRFDSRRVIVV